MFNYQFCVFFISPIFNSQLLQTVIPSAVSSFNQLPRKAGRRMRIAVTVDSVRECLNIDLDTEKPQNVKSCLRTAQYFSKVLKSQPGMSGYVVGGRLLTTS